MFIFTVWKFQNFPSTKILREIKIIKAISTLQNCTDLPKSKLGGSKMVKMAVLDVLNATKLISRKNCVEGKYFCGKMKKFSQKKNSVKSTC